MFLPLLSPPTRLTPPPLPENRASPRPSDRSQGALDAMPGSTPRVPGGRDWVGSAIGQASPDIAFSQGDGRWVDRAPDLKAISEPLMHFERAAGWEAARPASFREGHRGPELPSQPGTDRTQVGKGPLLRGEGYTPGHWGASVSWSRGGVVPPPSGRGRQGGDECAGPQGQRAAAHARPPRPAWAPRTSGQLTLLPPRGRLFTARYQGQPALHPFPGP